MNRDLVVGLARRVLAAAPFLVALTLALAAQGMRGLGEPDEGRAVQIAQAMLASGEWSVPRLHGAPYLDKPPLTYWAIAASLRCGGANELAARLPSSLAFAATTVLVGWLGGLLWGAQARVPAGLAYALSLGPFVASNLAVPDALLPVATTGAAALAWRLEREGRRTDWALLGGVVGLGILVKGAAMLVWSAPLAIFLLAPRIRRDGARALVAPGPWAALGLALAIGLPWFVATSWRFPGAADYFLGNQVTGRLFGTSYERNPEWSKVLTMYLPVLVCGALPWSVAGLASFPTLLHRWRARISRQPSRRAVLLALWSLLPLAVFSLARSRLPLYLLPLFAPVALVAGRGLQLTYARAGRVRRALALAAGLAWAVGLVALKPLAAERLAARDGRRLAAWIDEASRSGEGAVWSVDATLHSLPFYRLRAVPWTTTKPKRYPMFSPLPDLSLALRQERPRRALLVTPRPRLPVVAQVTRDAGYRCRERASTERLSLLACRRDHRAASSVSAARYREARERSR